MATAKTYPLGWANYGAALDNLVAHFVELRRFYRTAADNGRAALLAIT